jgi:phosphoribosyl 1,2-cyclic phosphate phosphodiesterase
MSVTHITTNIQGKLILLGTGTSVGVPMIGCGCEVCRSENPKNNRTRCSVLLGLPEGNLLIDTPPELRIQLVREQIGLVHAAAFTHEHADHIFGLDDLRLFQFYLRSSVPLYCEPTVEVKLRESFSYAFSEIEETHKGSRPRLEFQEISTEPFQVLGAEVLPLRLKHGPRFEVLGFRVGNVAYCTDTNEIPPETMERLQGLDVLILDALRYQPHATHFCLDEAVEIAQQLGVKRAIFTHISHELDHETVNRQLPAGMELGYDGMQIELS